MNERRPFIRPRVGIDNYGLFPLRFGAVATLAWARRHGAAGVAFSGFTPDVNRSLDDATLDSLRGMALEHDLYLEWGGAQHVPRDLVTWIPKSIDSVNRRAAHQARRVGARVVRSCSGGMMRWHDDAPSTESLLEETATALRAQRGLWEDLGLTLAIETHFEFTSHELVRLLQMCDAMPGGWLGICLDTMNVLTMLEDPVSATRRLLPWVVSTHIKDGGVSVGLDGLATFPTALGQGVVNISAIISLLDTLDREVHLNVEDHGGTFLLPVFNREFLAKFPDLTAGELVQLLWLAQNTAARGARQTARDAWPALAEARMSDDLRRLIAMARALP